MHFSEFKNAYGATANQVTYPCNACYFTLTESKLGFDAVDKMTEDAMLQRLAEQIRASGALGRSRLLKLFNFLVECSVAGTVPKEVVIAAEVFKKASAFDVSQDSIVRVYIYNLRRKLRHFYAGPGKNELFCLALPKGEYRLVVEPMDAAESVSLDGARGRLWTAWASAGVAILMCVALVGFDRFGRPQDPWVPVRSNSIWSRLLRNDKPIVVVVGDYYIFGDTQKTVEVTRLIREFSINSKSDLDQYLQMNPELADQYLDVGLGYLPTSAGVALGGIMPVLAATDKRRVRVVLMSALDPNTIKSSNIVYIGLLSGLGAMKDIVFSASRFQVGDSYDELIDRKTSHHYFSGANQYAGDHKALGGKFGYRDYGLFSTFAGPGGNQFIIIAGTQDEGLRQMGEAITDHFRLDELVNQADGRADFEALFEVLSLDNLNLNGRLLTTSPLNPIAIWSPR